VLEAMMPPSEVNSRQLTVKALSIHAVNYILWTVNFRRAIRRPKSLRPVVGPNSVRPWTSAAGPYIVFTAREQVAELIGALSPDVIFTSCTTESNNAAIAAALKANPAKRHTVTSQVEHSSVLNYCMALEKQKAPLLVQEGPRGSAGVVTNDGSCGFTPPDCSVDLRSTYGGRRPPLQPHGITTKNVVT